MKKPTHYDQKYAGKDPFWGTKPSVMCDKVLETIKPDAGFRPKLLDLGCGEGRNAIYFATKGFEVVGLDLSLPGLEKTRRYAREVGVEVATIHADIVEYELEDTYDVIFSTGTLHYLPPEVRKWRFQDYKEHATASGINALQAFVEKPFIPKAPDGEPHEGFYRSGALMGYYWDWEILYCTEEIFDCMSSGILHRHAHNRIIARRHRGGKRA